MFKAHLLTDRPGLGNSATLRPFRIQTQIRRVVGG